MNPMNTVKSHDDGCGFMSPRNPAAETSEDTSSLVSERAIRGLVTSSSGRLVTISCRKIERPGRTPEATAAMCYYRVAAALVEFLVFIFPFLIILGRS
jgi:hypothetical protein